MVSVEDDDLAGLEDVSSDGEDDNYEAELTDSETMSGAPSGRRGYRKRARGICFAFFICLVYGVCTDCANDLMKNSMQLRVWNHFL